MTQKSFVTFILGVAAISFNFAALSQETNAPKPAVAVTNRPPQLAAIPFLEGPIFNILTEDQRASVAKAFEGQPGKMRETQAKLRTMRQELFSNALNGKFDEEAVRKQAAAIANLESEVTVLRLKALSQAQPPLSQDQITKIKNFGPVAPAQQNVRPIESRPGRQRILQNIQRDENDLPPK